MTRCRNKGTIDGFLLSKAPTLGVEPFCRCGVESQVADQRIVLPIVYFIMHGFLYGHFL